MNVQWGLVNRTNIYPESRGLVIRKIMDSPVFSGYRDPFGHAKNLLYLAMVQLFATLLKPFCICYWGLVIRTNKG